MNESSLLTENLILLSEYYKKELSSVLSTHIYTLKFRLCQTGLVYLSSYILLLFNFDDLRLNSF